MVDSSNQQLSISRQCKILSWRISNTLEPAFCIEALEEALSRYGAPGIFNTDQGAQFTSNAFTKALEDNHVAISMDERGRCQDNIFIERLWWTLKHQYIYLHSFDAGKSLRWGLGKWIRYYNRERGHSSLDNRTPDEVYYGLPHHFAEAAEYKICGSWDEIGGDAPCRGIYLYNINHLWGLVCPSHLIRPMSQHFKG